MSTKRRIKWSLEEIISIISLRALSPKTYRYLRDMKNISLPCATTLHSWVTEFNTLPSILKVINIMSSKGSDLPSTEKLTVLTFDELYTTGN